MTVKELAVTQQLAGAAASTSIHAWLKTGCHACYLLTEARPIPQQFGDLRFDLMLLGNRAGKACELADAWSAVAEAWDEAARSVTCEAGVRSEGGARWSALSRFRQTGRQLTWTVKEFALVLWVFHAPTVLPVSVILLTYRRCSRFGKKNPPDKGTSPPSQVTVH